MRERPILFSAQMVRAILAGTKTQTRRAIKAPMYSQPVRHMEGGTFVRCVNGDEVWVRCPYGGAGDRLWVRETWADMAIAGYPPVYAYRADPDDGRPGWGLPPGLKWSPSIHMPRAASRITLEITEVRVERLQDISEADAKAEGVYPPPAGTDDDGAHFAAGTFRDGYRALWEQINGAGSWDANPWVWVLSFRRFH